MQHLLTAQATSDAREIGLVTTLMPTLLYTSLCGNNAIANDQANELVALADEKGSALWKAFGVLLQGTVLALAGKSSEAAQTITAGIGASVHRVDPVDTFVVFLFGQILHASRSICGRLAFDERSVDNN